MANIIHKKRKNVLGIVRWAQIKIHSVRSGSYHRSGKDKLNRAIDRHTMEISRVSDDWRGVMVSSDTTEVSKHYLLSELQRL
jgi:hypothetical protein